MQTALLLFTAALLGLSLIGGRFPEEQYLQHIPTVLALGAAAVAVRKGRLTTGSLACIVAFLWLHILGARYIYSNVPYDDWASSLFGVSVSETFGWRRNHYDRLVHFGFGVLCMPPAMLLAGRSGKMTTAWALTFGLLTVMTIGALYEIFEWLLTVFMSPEDADGYNGQQGDAWDAQKDMALALAGALIVAVAFAARGSVRQVRSAIRR
ncbi:MAG: DUF2238 domain-containing protein [Planctomycetaceae bacterium]